MPNCFQLIRKETGEAVPLVEVDEELCKVLEVPCDPKWYCFSWYSTIGFAFAMGKSIGDLRKDLKSWHLSEKEMEAYTKILDHIEEFYTVNAFYAPK